MLRFVPLSFNFKPICNKSQGIFVLFFFFCSLYSMPEMKLSNSLKGICKFKERKISYMKKLQLNILFRKMSKSWDFPKVDSVLKLIFT